MNQFQKINNNQNQEPPYSKEAEQNLLGAILVDDDILDNANENLSDKDFYFPKHKKIFSAMIDLNSNNKEVDMVTLAEYLQSNNILSNTSYLTTLGNINGSLENVDNYIEIIINKSKFRRIINLGQEIEQFGYKDNQEVDKVLNQIEEEIYSLSNDRDTNDFIDASNSLVKVFDDLSELSQTDSPVTGIPTGFQDLDKITSGFQDSDLIIIAARPSMGKTALALNIGQHIAIEEDLNIAIFSLEMSSDQLIQRMLCAEGQVSSQRLRTGNLADTDWKRLSDAAGELSKADIFIDDTPGITVPEIRNKLRRLDARHGIDIVFLDYLQLMEGTSGDTRQQEITKISRGLKGIGREFNVPMVTLSQLSRAVEQRNDKRPQLSDLRASGSIEQDADLVAFLYRDDYYNPDSEKKGITEIIIGKQRNGPVGTVELAFQKEYTKFIDLDYNY